MRFRPKLPIFLTLVFFNAFPSLAEAATSRKAPIQTGDRVLVIGTLYRKCSAFVDSLPSPGYARLRFDRAACGDGAQVYELKHLQHLSFVDKAHELAQGDSVVLKGHFGAACSGRVHEITRSGYVSVNLDSFLCADTEALYKMSGVSKVEFVKEAGPEGRRLMIGQKISTKGIHEGDLCRGEIRQLTNNGLASVAFEQLTCAYGGKLYPLDELSLVKPELPHKRASGELIFQRVMREIASQKKSKKNRFAFRQFEMHHGDPDKGRATK